MSNGPLPPNAIIVNGEAALLRFNFTDFMRSTPFGTVSTASGVDLAYEPANPPVTTFAGVDAVINMLIAKVPDYDTALTPPQRAQIQSAIQFLGYSTQYQQERLDAIFALTKTLQSYDQPSKT
jgi:hypothetical protein